MVTLRLETVRTTRFEFLLGVSLTRTILLLRGIQ